MQVLRIIVTAMNVLYVALLLYFVNRKDYENNKLSNFVFGTMMLSFGLSAVMMWK